MSAHQSGAALLEALESGEVRAATPTGSDEGAAGWAIHSWVKLAILDLFRGSPIIAQGVEQDPLPGTSSAFRDKQILPIRRFDDNADVRIVPGGSSVRRGSHLGSGVVCMPPMYINVGAFVGSGSMIDSHALVGSCAQIGSGVHVSAAAQIGGVLEPAGARPVIVEDGAFIGGGVGIYDGVFIGAGAVIAAGVTLAATTQLYDLPNATVLRGTRDAPLEVPAGAVVIPGTRPASGDFAREHGLSQACALIVKYRDAGTDAATTLEQALR
ncbi:MAG: 2,3,4,5-tetrahydropyridine-2-carboxylate N-succinyltransferase [Planctomycetota bacterium]